MKSALLFGVADFFINFFQKNKFKCFLFRIKSVTLQTEKGVLCNFGTNLKRKILKYNIIIKN